MGREQVPCGYWNDKENCRKAATIVSGRGELIIKYPGAYKSCKRNGWLDELLPRLTHPDGWWNTIEHCLETALDYKRPIDLRNAVPSCAKSIKKHGWENVCYAHMVVLHRKSDDELRIEASKYTDYVSFRENSPGAYQEAKKRGILDKICSHYIRPLNVYKTYTQKPSKELCKEFASQFTQRAKFKEEHPRLYSYALRHGFLDEICLHMERAGNYHLRCIYAAFFSDRSVYIGLTYNINRRRKQHLTSKKSAIYKHIQLTNLQPDFKVISEYVEKESASKLEGDTILKYANDGWTILNSAKAGSLGGNHGYSKEEVLSVAQRCSSLKEFRVLFSGYYQCGYHSDYWNDVKSLFVHTRHNKYSKDEAKAEASKYKSIKEFREKSFTIFEAARRNGWLYEICIGYDMSQYNPMKPHKYSEQQIQEATNLYRTTNQLKRKKIGIYNFLVYYNRLKDYYQKAEP